MKLTLDSNDSLEDALRVVGALYGVNLVVAGEAGSEGPIEPITPEEAVQPEEAGQPQESDQSERADQAEQPGEPEPGSAQATKGARGTRRAGRRNISRRRVGAVGADVDAVEDDSGALNVPRNADIRAWARENGLTVSSRGRVPASVLAAYRDAHGE